MSFALRVAPRREYRRVPVLFRALVVLSAVLANAAWAASTDPVGRVTVKINVVEAIAADGTVRTLGRTDPVYEGDTLRTGPRGRAQIRFTDRGLMSLRPASELAIDDYEFSAASPATSRQSLSLTRGGFRTMTGRIASANRSAYRVSTPLAVIGVRGTIWDAYQEVGGALLLGVGQGGITATTSAGEEARLGQGASYNYVRVNPDGSVEFLIEPPAELDNSPEVDEGADEEEEGADLGDAEDSSVAEGGGESESTAGTLGDSGSQLVGTTTDPDNTGAINQSNTGDGSLPTGTVVLSAADVTALITGTQVGIVAGVSSSDLDASGEFILGGDRIGVGSGLAAFDGNGGPLLVGAAGVSGFDPLFQTASRAELLGLADAVLNSRSGGPSSLFGGSTFQPAGGAAGVTWGSFAQPVKIFTDQSNSSRFVTTTGDSDILFAIGTPTDVADLTGTSSYGLVDFRVTTTGGRQVFDVISDAFLDFGTGDIFGILDVKLLETTTSTAPRYDYIVDWEGSVQGGLLTDVALTLATLLDSSTGSETAAEGEITGFLSGTGGEFLNLGFSYYVAGDPSFDTSGLVLLQAGVESFALTADEILEFQQGRVFVGVECCDFDSGAGGGVAGDPMIVGGAATNPLQALGINVDAFGEDLGPLDAGFLDPLSVENVLRPGFAIVSQDPSFPVPPEIELIAGSWSVNQGETAFVADAVTGALIEPLDDDVLFFAGFPSNIATLQARGFTTFSGASNEFADPGTGPIQTLGGFAVTNRDVVEPGFVFSPGASVSFNVDLANGQVTNGHLFALQEIDATGLFPEEFGFRVFFDGQVGYVANNTFIDVRIVDGAFNELGVIDIAESEIEIFLAGDGPSNFIALGAYNIKSADATPIVAAGTFSIGNGLSPETRLTALDALRLSPPGEVRLGVAAFSRLQSGAPGGLPIGAEGLLLGRAGFAGQPAAPFLLGANALYVVDDGMGIPVPTNTARRGFFDQPFDFVLRKNLAVDNSGLFATNVIPTGGADFTAQGFNIGWGGWQSTGAGDASKIQDDPNNAANGVLIDRDVFFASVNPTPQSQMPAIGAFSYGGVLGGSPDARVIGGGSGLISGNSGSTAPFTAFSVGFDVDFGTGNISNGNLSAVYNNVSVGTTEWVVGFDGFVNGAIADLQVSTLAITQGGSPVGGATPLAPFDNSISGIFTGPAGQRFGGGFSLTGSDGGTLFESIQGVFVIDQN